MKSGTRKGKKQRMTVEGYTTGTGGGWNQKEVWRKETKKIKGTQQLQKRRGSLKRGKFS